MTTISPTITAYETLKPTYLPHTTAPRGEVDWRILRRNHKQILNYHIYLQKLVIHIHTLSSVKLILIYSFLERSYQIVPSYVSMFSPNDRSQSFHSHRIDIILDSSSKSFSPTLTATVPIPLTLRCLSPTNNNHQTVTDVKPANCNSFTSSLEVHVYRFVGG